MARRTDFQAATTYTGQKLKGAVDISFKIDGVRILDREGIQVTRNDKVPPGLELALTPAAKAKIQEYKDCEIYLGSFHESNSPMQQHSPVRGCIHPEHVYPLDYEYDGATRVVDPRLYIETIVNPTANQIRAWLQIALDKGYEGLVLRTDKKWYRVKPEYTADVYITGWFEQFDTKKNPKGQLGGFETNYGKLTAFSEAKRQELWDNPQQYIGRMMTVRYKELYDTGSFRYCVTFEHFRDDKDEEAFDTKAGEIVSW